jgi:hypothetical protein
MKFAIATLLILASIVNPGCNQPVKQRSSNMSAGKPNIDSLLNSTDTNKSIIELDNYIAKLCEYGENLEKLNEHQKVFFLNQQLEREVNNGGFNQYFFNSSGDYANETINSLNQIGAKITAGILKEAIQQFPNGQVPLDESERRQIIAEIEKKGNLVWNQLDDRFYKYDDDLNALNFKYLTDHKEAL